MNNVVKRVILFVFAIPALLSLIMFLPQLNHLALIILAVIVGVLCGMEVRKMMSNVAKPMGLWTIFIPAVAPLASWAQGMELISPIIPDFLLTAGVLWALSDSILAKEAEFSNGITRVGTRLIMVMYPGWLLWWIGEFTWFDNANILMLIFVLTVYLNDSLAWFFGMLFGRHRGIVKVSPKKSLEGYIAGIFTSVTVILISARLRPDILPHPLWQLIIFGLIMAFTTISGDLAESVLKRATGVKDSGNVILGRGGMLDSIDSILFSAPVFVLFLKLGGL